MQKRWIAAAFAMLLVLACAGIAGAYPAMDGSRAASLTVHAADKESGAAISGLRFTLYKAADVSCEEGKDISFSFTDSFLKYDGVVEMNLNPKGINSSDWAQGAENVKSHVLGDAASGANTFETYTAVTDASGIAAFGGVSQGLYLMLGSYEGTAYKSVEVTPSFLTIPQLSDDQASWIYDVAVDAKTKVTIIPTRESESESEKESEKESESETVSVSVRKAWSGDDAAGVSERRPESITVNLLDAQGNIVDTQELSTQNGWSFTWTGLTEGEWLVAESNIPEGYSVSQVSEVTDGGKAVTITNTTPPSGVQGVSRDGNNTPSTVDGPGTSTDSGPGNSGVKGASRERGVKGKNRTRNEQGVKGSYREGDTGSVLSAARLPQTGQLWWPVWLLSGIAAAMVVLGLVLRISGKKDLKERNDG